MDRATDRAMDWKVTQVTLNAEDDRRVREHNAIPVGEPAIELLGTWRADERTGTVPTGT